MALDRNTQFNPGGDPAKEKAFIESQEERTSDVARASLPQIITSDQGDLTDAIRGADVLDTGVSKPGYEAPDAPVGSAQGANVNAEFEDNVRTGAGAEGDPGEAADTEADEPVDAGGTVEVADPQGGDLVENKSDEE